MPFYSISEKMSQNPQDTIAGTDNDGISEIVYRLNGNRACSWERSYHHLKELKVYDETMADNTKQNMLIDVIESLPREACLFDTSLVEGSRLLPSQLQITLRMAPHYTLLSVRNIKMNYSSV